MLFSTLVVETGLKAQLKVFYDWCSALKRNAFVYFFIFFIFYFYLYIYPPDSQESAVGAIQRPSNYPDLLPEMPRYCCPLEILRDI